MRRTRRYKRRSGPTHVASVEVSLNVAEQKMKRRSRPTTAPVSETEPLRPSGQLCILCSRPTKALVEVSSSE